VKSSGQHNQIKDAAFQKIAAEEAVVPLDQTPNADHMPRGNQN
jgi:hypothetical protein